ncbi:hypothetical protein LCGC14_0430420 [marine sediment metagenome]|uniref:Uncharacterized protein n=1 Tax=marine sediment metagenome TaxID=412755 RepID=A0A0F9SUB2_9ZZZZ
MNAIYTAAINPDEAYNIIVSLQRMMFPEIEDQLREQEAQQSKIFEEEKGYIWVLQTGEHGHKYGTKVKLEDAPDTFRKWASEKGLY